MADEARGLHHLGFEPKVRFLRQAGEAGFWAECVVCGESLFGPSAEARAAATNRHRHLIHVVMVYPYGMPRPAPRLRRARSEVRPTKPAAGSEV